MDFTLEDIPSVLERHREIHEEDPYRAHEITEAAARYAMGQTECSRQELEDALHTDIDTASSEQRLIVRHFYAFMHDVQS